MMVTVGTAAFKYWWRFGGKKYFKKNLSWCIMHKVDNNNNNNNNNWS